MSEEEVSKQENDKRHKIRGEETESDSRRKRNEIKRVTRGDEFKRREEETEGKKVPALHDFTNICCLSALEQNAASVLASSNCGNTTTGLLP